VRKNSPTKAKPLVCGPKATRDCKNLVNLHLSALERGDFAHLSPEEFIKMHTAIIKEIRECLDSAEPVKDSGNSSVPPGKNPLGADKGSGKGPRYPKREKKKNKLGGQKGHKGSTIQDPGPADEIIYLNPRRNELENNPAWRKIKTESRKIVDVKCEKKVTEYIAEEYENVETGEKVSSKFPGCVKANIQFGLELHETILNLREVIQVPFNKIALFVQSIFGISISESSICNIVRKYHHSAYLKDFEKRVKEAIINTYCVHADETGISLKGKTKWVHVLATEFFCLFSLQKGRSLKDIKRCGVIQHLTGILVHDSWNAYYIFTNVLHCLCNAHINRELKLAGEMGHKSADSLLELLLEANNLVKENDGVLELSEQDSIRQRYRKFINSGLNETGGKKFVRPPGQEGKRGKIAKPKYRNLLERLDHREDDVLRFITDKDAPYTNNLAEQIIRSLKIHEKISGTFKSRQYATGSLRMKSYLATCEKNSINAAEAIRMLVTKKEPSFLYDQVVKSVEAQKLAA
jgi:transposase